MPESLVHRFFGSGNSLVRGPNNGSLFRTASGVPGGCCCGCAAYFKATLCNETCVGEPDSVYVCEDAVCFHNEGTYLGPILHGKIVRFGNRCYRVDGRTRYCPPDPFQLRGPGDGLGGGTPGGGFGTGGGSVPIPCVPMPPGAVIASVARCHDDCHPDHCPPINGWYQLTSCSCSGTPTPTNNYICCEKYEEALKVAPCPTFGSGCLIVVPGTQPVATLPQGAIGGCQDFNFPNCQECCCNTIVTVPPHCCRCTRDSILTTYSCTGGEQIFPRCWYSARNGTVSGCGTRSDTLSNGCISFFACFEVSQTQITVRSWEGFNDCIGRPTQNVGCSCGTRVNMAVSQVNQPEFYPIGNDCEAPGFPPLFQAGASPCGQPFCHNGTLFTSCDLNQIGYFSNGAACGGADVLIEAFTARTSTPGVCGFDCGGGARQIVLPDGSPAGDIGKVKRTGGCAGCGGVKGERL